MHLAICVRSAQLHGLVSLHQTQTSINLRCTLFCAANHPCALAPCASVANSGSVGYSCSCSTGFSWNNSTGKCAGEKLASLQLPCPTRYTSTLYHNMSCCLITVCHFAMPCSVRRQPSCPRRERHLQLWPHDTLWQHMHWQLQHWFQTSLRVWDAHYNMWCWWAVAASAGHMPTVRGPGELPGDADRLFPAATTLTCAKPASPACSVFGQSHPLTRQLLMRAINAVWKHLQWRMLSAPHRITNCYLRLGCPMVCAGRLRSNK